MNRLIPMMAGMLLAFGGLAHAGDCCPTCKPNCPQWMCKWATCDVLRYKVEHKECPPPCCECCEDRWILGCCKPIKIVKFKPYHEPKKFLVGKYLLNNCLHCAPNEGAAAIPPGAPVPPPASPDKPPRP